jgi:tetratricopeptide (TPR) repeat protein
LAFSNLVGFITGKIFMSTELQQQSFQTEGELLEWASNYVSVDAINLITDHPWARTYCITSEGERYFLKDVPPEQTGALSAVALLSDAFPEIVAQVVASNPEAGLIIQRDHGGEDVGSRPSTKQRIAILGTYATLQAGATKNVNLLASLPKFELSSVVDRFFSFLDGNEEFIESNGRVNAAHFLHAELAQDYSSLFNARRSLLEQLVVLAEQLPVTINHCDLRPQNTAVSNDGKCLIFDWDEAIAGPAGLSLHSSFSGCSVPGELMLCQSGPIENRDLKNASRLLRKYVATLSDNGYSDPATLLQSLPGSICAGVMHYLMSYSKFPVDNDKDRVQVSNILERRLDDMLNLCDALAIQSRDLTLELVEQYEQLGAFDRAKHLLEGYLSEVSVDEEIERRLALALINNGEGSDAEKHLRNSLELNPTSSEAHEALGDLLFDELKFDESVQHLEEAVRLSPGNQEVEDKLSEARELGLMQSRAAEPGCVPTIRFSAAEIEQLAMSRPKRKLAARLFRKHGCLLIENAFSPELLNRMEEQFVQRYQHFFEDKRHDSALRVGDKRFMITVAMEGLFRSPEVFSPTMVMPIIERILGKKCILGSFTSVTSLPKSEDMKMHKDHPLLFDGKEFSEQLPSFGVTMLVPLLGITEELGTTRVVKGSHRVSSKESRDMEHQDPYGPQGACLLMDYRLSHQGLANRSDRVRPVMSLVYSRPWFRDHVNYNKQQPLLLSDAEFEQIPDEHKSLLEWLKRGLSD